MGEKYDKERGKWERNMIKKEEMGEKEKQLGKWAKKKIRKREMREKEVKQD